MGRRYLIKELGMCMGSEYSILENFVDPMRISKKSFEKAGLSVSYDRLSLHVFMA